MYLQEIETFLEVGEQGLYGGQSATCRLYGLRFLRAQLAARKDELAAIADTQTGMQGFCYKLLESVKCRKCELWCCILKKKCNI